MSDVQQPVVQAPADGTAAVPPTTVTDWAQPEPTTGAATDAGAAPAQDDAIGPVDQAPEGAEVKKPVTEGSLGYKAPGLVKSLRFSKKYFWLGKEAVLPKDLHQYLRGEKPEHTHHNAAWSSQTGEGLLYFSKSAEQKATPAGIINLTEISDLAKDGALEFHFKLHGQKHVMQAASTAERDGWVATLNDAAAQGKTSARNIAESAGYKEHLEKLGKPAVPMVAAAPIKVEGVASRKSAEGLKAEETSSSSSDEEGKKVKKEKARSASRKRGSLFGSLLGKKENEDKKAEPKDDRVAAAPPKLSDTDGDTKLENKATDAAFDAEAVAARVVAEPVVSTGEEKPVPKNNEPSLEERAKVSTPVAPEPTTPAGTADISKQNKRNSFFGSFFQKKETPAEEKSEKEVMPAVAAKETEATAKVNTAHDAQPIYIPQHPTPGAVGEPSPSTPKEKSPVGFFGKFLKYEKPKTAEKKEDKSDGEGAAAAQVSTPSEPAHAPVPSTEPSVPADNAKDDVETPAADVALPAAIKTADPAKDKRRTSFFSPFGGKKEKKPDGTSDAENVEGEPKNRSAGTSPIPKLGGLFRMPSRSAKAHLDGAKTGQDTKVADNAPQVPESVTSLKPAGTENVSETEHSQARRGAIGDVVPDAVVVGQSDKAGAVGATA